MKYKHLTLGHSIAGLSPQKIISALEKDGYIPLYSNLAKKTSEFFEVKDPFKVYKKIITKKSEYPKDENGIAITHLVSHTISREQKRWKRTRPYYRSKKPLSFGELFRNEKDSGIIFSFYDDSIKDRERLWFSCWTSKNIELDESLERFINAILQAIGCEKNSEEILESDTFSRSHKEIREELKEYNLNAAIFADKKSSYEILSKDECKNTLIDLSKKGNILLSEFLKDYSVEEKEQKENLLKFLTGQKFLTRELIVICNKTGQWWNVTIPSKEKMKEIENLGISCTSCGAKINDEKIDQFYKMSEKGKKMISGSYWMVGRVVNELLSLGVRENEIFVNVTNDGEEIDVIALFMAKLLVFELKDREFGLGDSYKFHGKISRLNEKTSREIYPIVVTTKAVASEAKKLLKEVERIELQYIFAEGLESFSEKISKIFDNVLKDIIRERCDEIKQSFPAILLMSKF